MASISAVVLAAGRSTRMGQPKLLLPWTDGQPLLVAVISQLLPLALHEIVVVTGAYVDASTLALRHLPVRCVHNPDFADGMLTSLQAGLRALPTSAAALVVPADLGQLTSATVAQICAAYVVGQSIVPTYHGQRGHPVLLDRSAWPALLQLQPPAQPRTALEQHQPRLLALDTPAICADIDTPADYERLRRR